MPEISPATPSPASLPRQLLAEGVGTFGLVLVGTGAIAGAEELDWFANLGISLAFGAVVLAMILAFGNTSGAHINPAVTIGFAAAGRFERRRVLPFIAAQLIGGALASAAIRASFPTSVNLGATLPKAGWLPTFGIEVLITFVLMSVILWISSHPLSERPRTGLFLVAFVVGATVALAAYTAGPFTGASMNPARSLGPALMSGRLDPIPLYFAAPILGACLAVPVCRQVVCRQMGRDACCPEIRA